MSQIYIYILVKVPLKPLGQKLQMRDGLSGRVLDASVSITRVMQLLKDQTEFARVEIFDEETIRQHQRLQPAVT